MLRFISTMKMRPRESSAARWARRILIRQILMDEQTTKSTLGVEVPDVSGDYHRLGTRSAL
jgi:hypothetical protein